MNCGYSFLVYLFRFPLLIGELLTARLYSTFFAYNRLKPTYAYCSDAPITALSLHYVSVVHGENLVTQSVKVLNRIFAVLVKANPSRETNYREFVFNVKEQ